MSTALWSMWEGERLGSGSETCSQRGNLASAEADQGHHWDSLAWWPKLRHKSGKEEVGPGRVDGAQGMGSQRSALPGIPQA